MKTCNDYLTSDRKYPERLSKATSQIKLEAYYLLACVDGLMSELGIEQYEITSGFRTAESNAAAGGSKNSAHLTGEAVDISDSDKKLAENITSELLTRYKLYMEQPSKTPGWIHLTTRAPKSGKRIFYP